MRVLNRSSTAENSQITIFFSIAKVKAQDNKITFPNQLLQRVRNTTKIDLSVEQHPKLMY